MLPLHRTVRSQLCRLSTAACVTRQIPLPVCSLKTMSPAQKPISSPPEYSSIAADKLFVNVSTGVKQQRSTQLSWQTLHVEAMEFSGSTSVNKKRSQSIYEAEYPSLSVNIGSSSRGRNSNKRRTRIDLGLDPRLEAVNSSQPVGMANTASLQEPEGIGKKKFVTKYVQKSPSGQSKSKNFDCSEDLHKVERFSICFPRRRDIGIQEVLRPGMVLLKRYLSLHEQISIVKICQTLGVGPRGFYRPGYKDGAKLSLYMMCLGLNWDPQTRKYDKRHPVDDCEPPNIPCEFRLLVQRAIQDAHSLIKKKSGIGNAEDILPSMSPDICIINFYTTYGRLGLHQDRDESRESLDKGLPVVSFSIGNSAEFLYGNQRDVEQAEKVVLDSGDVLIFGGESRMVFHGVPSIIPDSAPRALIKETGLRPGRLNLTFRQL